MAAVPVTPKVARWAVERSGFSVDEIADAITDPSLALALKRLQSDVGVLTQERKDLPKKCSVSTACGHLGIVWVRLF